MEHDAAGRRSVQIEVEVHGTPEEVWDAIATGPGVSSWFVPASFEEQDGKVVSASLTFGPGMVSRAAITAWDKPRMYAKESPGWIPGSPPMATEWHIEARAGGTCVVRIVHSLIASTADWDHQLEGAKGGWPAFLRTLQLYLQYFRGQHAAIMQLSAQAAGSDADVWTALTSALGAQHLNMGQVLTTPTDAPALHGVLEYASERPFDALLRIDLPAPGIAALGVASFPGGPTMAAVNLYLYGEGADAVVAQQTPIWNAWLQSHFPAQRIQ